MKYSFILSLVLISVFAQAQNYLTPEDAVSTAIENNFDIKIAKNNLEIDQINVNRGNAGMLPSLTGEFNMNNSILNSKQERADGTIQELNGARNNALNYGVNLNWTIFDGFSMFARYDQLKEFQKQGEAELKTSVVTLASQVLATYFDLIQQHQILEAYREAIDLSQFRLTLAETRFEIGKAAKLEVLNAKVDLNTDQTNLLRQLELIENTKTYLNLLMAEDLKTPIVVQSEWEINQELVLDELISLAEQQNPIIQTALINQTIAEQELKRIKGNRYPQIALNTGYNFTHSENTLGFARVNDGRGFNYGVSVSLNIFNGLIQKRNESIAKIQIENSQVLIDQQRQNIQSQIISNYQTYQTNLELITLELSNEEIAKENLDITLEKFRIGTITTLEVRTAQQNYIDAMTRVSDAKFQAKISEIRLRELAGNVLN
ncbi:TolC family protein [Moheibacter sediminis]|uniref:Outer membrane protein TolC n=1 Tax=Moheibacter sediminis TaxID=1434700 RepID=A0A1W2AZT5_9FLAO|nr:TolC family protein [Moheibacter sediminis]SMC66235.1 Outer membrane protein TolC [Moheibacter sediminis]